MSSVSIGILEDDQPQAELLQRWLAEEDYQVCHCTTGEAFLREVKARDLDMLLLDWQLPDCEGIDVLVKLRNQLHFSGPIIFATAKDSEDDIVMALNKGADDYLVKPLRKNELSARLSSIWRRFGGKKAKLLTLGPIQIDIDQHRVHVDGEEVTLTATEFRLAVCVLQNEGNLLSREFLLKDVWGVGAELDTRTVDMHMSRVRRLLKIGPDMGYCVKTVYRHGYRLEKL
jgi:DNA-binding response OmpR family regulator